MNETNNPKQEVNTTPVNTGETMEMPAIKSDVVQNQPVNQDVANPNPAPQPQAQPPQPEVQVAQSPQPAPAQPVATEQHVPKIEDKVIYNIKQEKGGNILGVIFFFAVILSAVYFLPDIYKNIGKYIPGLGSQEIAIVPRKEENDEKDKDKKEETTIYKLNGDLKDVKFENLSFGNFIKTEESGKYWFKFYIINDSEKAFVFDSNTKFYIDLYQNNTYLKSLLVHSFEQINSKATKEFAFEIDKSIYSKVDGFLILRKNKSEIPDINLETTEGDYKILVCKDNSNYTTSYYFLNNYLEKIEDTYVEKNTEATYSDDLNYYRNLGLSYEQIQGMEYYIVETTAGFVLKLTLNLNEMNESDLYKLANYKYFNHNKESKEVAFEMTALGYTCS